MESRTRQDSPLTHSLLLGERLFLFARIERLIREALANYLGNAIKYTPRGGNVVVSASDEHGVVRVTVTDDGPGIAKDAQARLFQEFVRTGSQAAKTDRSGGIGLGLSIVRRIAEAHGGRAGVASEPGLGSTFFMEFRALPG